MQKKPLAAVLALCLILTASGCSQSTKKPSADDPARLSTPSETVEKTTPEEPTTKAAVTTAATTEAKKQSFPYSFDKLCKSAESLSAKIQILDPVELDVYTLNTLHLGSGSDETTTWIYCYQDKTTDEILAVRLLCPDISNFRNKSLFWECADLILNFTGEEWYSWRDYINRVYRKNGLTVDIMQAENDSHEGLNLVAWTDGHDFSDEEYHSLSLWEEAFDWDDYPLLTYDDIATGDYSGQNYCIEAVIDQVYKSASSYDFSLWYPSGETYVFKSMCSADITYYGDIFSTIKDGMIIRYAAQVYHDNTFGPSNMKGIEVVGEASLEDVYAAMRASCENMNYENLMRNPKDYEGKCYQVSGSIFQVISESSTSAKYLLATDAGYVYLNWYCPEDIRGMNFLEEDSVTVYGEFSGRKTYDTLTGKNTVPSIKIYTMDLN